MDFRPGVPLLAAFARSGLRTELHRGGWPTCLQPDNCGCPTFRGIAKRGAASFVLSHGWATPNKDGPPAEIIRLL